MQILRTEVLLEFIGDADGAGAPRLAEPRPEPDKLDRLPQVVDVISARQHPVDFDLVRLGPHLTQPPDIRDHGQQTVDS